MPDKQHVRKEVTVKGHVDGKWYDDMSQAPDLGSIRCVSNEGMIRHYHGLTADRAKLLLIDYVETGSSCFMQDNGKIYFFNKSTKNWYDPTTGEVVT